MGNLADEVRAGEFSALGGQDRLFGWLLASDRDHDGTIADARQELTRTQDAIEKITGIRPVLMRPPEGRTNRKVAKICR